MSAENATVIEPPPPGPPGSMEQLAALLNSAVEQLKQSGAVSPGAVTEAQQQSLELIARFQATLDAAAKHAAMQGKRIPAKTTPVAMETGSRVTGKQKQFISDYFSSSKKARTVEKEDLSGERQAPANPVVV